MMSKKGIAYDWKTEVQKVKKYSNLTLDELEKLYSKSKDNLNIKHALMLRYHSGDDLYEYNEDDRFEILEQEKYKNEDKYKALLDELIKANHGSSIVYLSTTYEYWKKEDEQIKLLNKAIDIGFLPAFDNLCYIYRNKKLKLKKTLEKGMVLGYGGAYYWYALKVEKNKKKRQELIEYAADVLNDERAQEYISNLYEITGNQPKAFEYMLKSAKNYNPSAMDKVGKFYEGGIGIRKNIVQAEKWYHTAMEYGSEHGKHHLAMLYLKTNRETQGFNLLWENRYRLSESMHELGICYRDGIGCEVDEVLAFECFETVVNDNFYEYNIDLAECYYKGIGTAQNYVEATEQLIDSHPYDSYNPEKFVKIKSELEKLKCSHCGEFGTKIIKNGVEVCKKCSANWNEMTLNSTKKLNIEQINVGDINLYAIGDSLSSEARYISNDYFNEHGYDYFDTEIFKALKGGEYKGGFVYKTIQNPEVKPYANKGDNILRICEVVYQNKKILDAIISGIEIYARAQGIRIAEFNAENPKYKSFYNKLEKYKNIKKVGNYFILQPQYQIAPQIHRNLQTRHAEIGEEYDIGVGSPKDILDGETYLGYIESENMKYPLGLNYFVAYDTQKCLHKGYAVGSLTRVTDYKTYNCYFIKEFFVDTQEDEKYNLANKLFNFITEFCKFHLAEFIKIKIIPNKHYLPFYDYCKHTLGFVEKEGYLEKPCQNL